MSDWRDAARQRVKEKQSGGTIKLVEGTNCIRVLPDKKDLTPEGLVKKEGLMHAPLREIRVHRDVGTDKAFNIRCGIEVNGKGKCWLCQVKIKELEKTGVSAKRTQAAAMAPQDVLVLNASRYDPDTQKFSAAKPWWLGETGGNSLGVRIHSKIAGSAISKKDYVSPTKGYNINIERTGTGLKTRYPEVEGDETPTKVPASILVAMKDLDEVIPVYDEEKQKAAYYGRDVEEDDTADRKRRRGKPAEEEDPEEVDADEEEADEEEEETEDEPEEPAEDEEEAEEAEEADEEEPEEDPEEPEEDPEEVEPEEEPEEDEEEPEEKPAPKKKVAAKPVKKAVKKRR